MSLLSGAVVAAKALTAARTACAAGLCPTPVLGLVSRQAPVEGGPQERGGVLVVRAAGRLVRVDRLSRRTATGAAVLTAFL